MARVLRIGRKGKLEEAAQLPAGLESLDTRVALIQALIPLGLQAVEEVLQREVELLAGPRYARRDGAPDRVRWRRVLHTWTGHRPVYLRVRPRWVRCGQCGKVFTESFPGIRRWGRLTDHAEGVLL